MGESSKFQKSWTFEIQILTLKAQITTAADNKFCDIFPDFRQQ